MSATHTAPPVAFTNETIIENYDLTFDPGDKLNGSLYLCTPRGAADTRPEPWVDELRAAGLWSAEPARQVPDEQRQAYKEGLIFVAAIVYAAGQGHVVLTRFDHPKFPSSSDRWEAWVDFCDVRHERID